MPEQLIERPEAAVRSIMRPMGPLEEGDQLLITAMERIEDGYHHPVHVPSSGWSKVDSFLQEGLAQKVEAVTVEAEKKGLQHLFSDKWRWASERVIALSDEESITARIEVPVGKHSKQISIHAAAGNTYYETTRARNELSDFDAYPLVFPENRVAAQALKKAAATRINANIDYLLKL